MYLDPPGHGIGIHWKAIAMLPIPPALGWAGSFALKDVSLLFVPVIWLLALPIAGVIALKYSSYVADTHAQPWGYISFLAAMGSFILGLMIACSTMIV